MYWPQLLLLCGDKNEKLEKKSIIENFSDAFLLNQV
jgi:hypothetical protein